MFFAAGSYLFRPGRIAPGARQLQLRRCFENRQTLPGFAA
jgi:hypothetical protein